MKQPKVRNLIAVAAHQRRAGDISRSAKRGKGRVRKDARTRSQVRRALNA